MTTPAEQGSPDLARFIREYGHVRRAEGRSMTVEDLRRLPSTTRRHPNRWEWRVRRASYEAMLAAVFAPATPSSRGVPARDVLDLGAGNGWLSHRLARLGHRLVALDVSLDAADGLGAAAAFEDSRGVPLLSRLCASFQRLPLTDSSADVAVYNASFHYAPEPEAALREALRVLRSNGVVVIMDSPFYATGDAGEAMVAERRAHFTASYGFASDAHGGREYLTWDRLAALGRATGIAWEFVAPWRGLRFALRPWRARVARRRPPARFPVAVGRRSRAPGSQAGPA